MSKFKVGDTVRCVSNYLNSKHLTVGQEYKVAAFSDSGRCIRINNGSSFVFCKDRFELVVPPVPEPKFKVGDTVCCVSSHGYYGQYLTVGQEYKVEGLRIGCIRVNNGSSFVFDEDRFELVVPPVPEPKFKVGDTVRCFDNGKLEGVLREGCLYVINNISGNSFEFKGNRGFYFSRSRFDLVTPKPCEPRADPTYTVTWKAPVRAGYKSVVDGELSFGTEGEAKGFAELFRFDVRRTVTKD
jgi:hypothetical protein